MGDVMTRKYTRKIQSSNQTNDTGVASPVVTHEASGEGEVPSGADLVIPVPVTASQGLPAVGEGGNSHPDIMRRRSERPVEPKPEVEPTYPQTLEEINAAVMEMKAKMEPFAVKPDDDGYYTVMVPDVTRRRSEKPKEGKPEVEPVTVPKLDNLGSNEVTGLVEEAIYAHDMQDTVVRFDTVGRKWTFRPDQELGQTVFYIECAIPALTENLTISNSRFGLDGSRDEVKLAIEQLDEAVR